MRQIIASGGHGYEDPECVRLNQYVVEQASKTKPKVCLLAQAGGEHPDWIAKFHKAFGELGCETSELSLFFPHTHDIEGFLMSQDIIFVSGGNTKSLLALWRAWGVEQILREVWEQGVILAGSSAGANCWFQSFITDSIPGQFSILHGLALLPGSFCPHYDSEAARQPAFRKAISSGDIPAGYAADDQVALHFVDVQMLRAVTTIEGNQAWQVDGSGVEMEVEPAAVLR